MTSVFDERQEFLKSPYLLKREYGNFSPFYITVAICSVVLAIIFVINIVLGCCTRYSEYWNDRFTGNRWIISLWTATPHNQPSLDYTELELVDIPSVAPTVYQPAPQEQQTTVQHSEYLELQHKRESAI
ncbi:uncharacterized protein LOC108744286 [Agrilus planipennis]|uniref:Uncharacterized protein LOC108744286 n=1 Tax=Agrilus planipennis TaxID=224129 RepID=A0A7F5R994_AGRPL|nr:uncharacterized protein LOC108744286 [Agrilus planipennis]